MLDRQRRAFPSCKFVKYDQKGSNATAHLEHLSLSRVICVNGNGRVSIAFLLQVRMTQSDNPTLTVVTD